MSESRIQPRASRPPRARTRPARLLVVHAGLVASALTAAPSGAAAQTRYYNTDMGRPTRIEDAYAIERYSLDLYVAPLAVERRRGEYEWFAMPELAYGIVPRTQVGLGLPIASRSAPEGRRTGLAGVNLSALYNFNVETRSFPAFGARASVLVPAGSLAPENVHSSLQGMATRTFDWARVHANVAYTFGDEPTAGVDGVNLTRWTSGVAVDRTFPLRSFLVSAEAFASQPLGDDAETQWTAGAGIRYQLTPNLSIDGGIARRLTGDDRGWSVTFGLARVLGVRALPPGLGIWRGG